MEIEGKIIMDLGITEGVSQRGNSWKKRELVLETLSQNFPRKVKFHIFGSRVDEIQMEVGKNYVIQFDLESREFNGRWYTDVSCYAARESMPQSVPGMSQSAPTMPQSPGMPGGFPQASVTPDFIEGTMEDNTGDLPF